MSNQRHHNFSKQWIDLPAQIKLLQSRGLIVSDTRAATAFLQHVQFFALNGYCGAFEVRKHVFAHGTTLEHVQAAYNFDRELRDLFTEALEWIEIDIRSSIGGHVAATHGPFGHLSPENFFRPNKPFFLDTRQDFHHARWRSQLQKDALKSLEPYVLHFREKYEQFPDLPIWIATEVMPFGSLSKMYAGMLRQDQRAIAGRYGIQNAFLESWLHHLVHVRNLCAHHARLWDRVFVVRPNLPPIPRWQSPLLPGNDRLFCSLLIIAHMLRRCLAIESTFAQWRERVESHFKNPPLPAMHRARMGLTQDWLRHPVWTGLK